MWSPANNWLLKSVLLHDDNFLQATRQQNKSKKGLTSCLNYSITAKNRAETSVTRNLLFPQLFNFSINKQSNDWFEQHTALSHAFFSPSLIICELIHGKSKQIIFFYSFMFLYLLILMYINVHRRNMHTKHYYYLFIFA